MVDLVGILKKCTAFISLYNISVLFSEMDLELVPTILYYHVCLGRSDTIVKKVVENI